jgi:DNA-binding MarR family transcriptional regulator
MLSIGERVAMAASTPPDDAWTGFALAVFRVNGLIMRAGEGISRPLGQSSARWQVLGRAFEPQTVAAMAKDMGHARQSVQRVADALVADGLVACTAHPTDRRTRLLELTPLGMQVLGAMATTSFGAESDIKAWADRVALNPAAMSPDQVNRPELSAAAE